MTDATQGPSDSLAPSTGTDVHVEAPKRRRPLKGVARIIAWTAVAMAAAGVASAAIQTWFVKTMPCDLNGDGYVSTPEAVEVNNSALRSVAGLTEWLLVVLLLAVPGGVIAAFWSRRWWPLWGSVASVVTVGLLLTLVFDGSAHYDYYFCGD
jgi:hypothetical protein